MALTKPYPTELVVVVSSIEKIFKHVFVPFGYSPRQRCVSLRTRIGISHINALDKTLDEKEVVFCTYLSIIRDKRQRKLPLTAFLRRALVFISAITLSLRGQLGEECGEHPIKAASPLHSSFLISIT